jgi:3-dehydroquinate synthase
VKFDLDLPSRDHVVVITDPRVGALYADDLIEELRAAHERVDLLTIPGDEACKNQTTKTLLEKQLFECGADRNTLIVVLGGGVVGDLVGFVAATFMRGVDYVQIPTTLLAMVDSSIGGKTAINNEFGKNLIGAIWHPIQIVRRAELLKTLDDGQFVNGLIEALKIFMACDAEYFAYSVDNLDAILRRDEAILDRVVARAMELKLEIVGRDEREKGERAILNLGHTVSHGFELLSDYQLLHGFSVGLGLDVEARIAVLDGCLDAKVANLIHELMVRLGLGPELCQQWTADQVWEAMQHDKKTRKSQVNYIALADIGKVCRLEESWIRPVDRTRFDQAYQEFLAS